MIQSVSRALTILDIVADEPARPKLLSEIAAKAGLKPGTCANLLLTLVELQYLEQVASRKGYVLGVKAYRLGGRGGYRPDLCRASEPLMAALAARLRETVLLAVLVGGRRVVLSQVSGDEVFQLRDGFVHEDNIYGTATGRLLMAHLPEAEAEAIVTARGQPTESEWPEAKGGTAIKSALQRIRSDGYAITKADLVGVAFPVFQEGRVVASLGLFLPAFRFRGEHRKGILRGMDETSKGIGGRLAETPS